MPVITTQHRGSSFPKTQYAETQNDALSGLDYVQARYYSAAQGQFISEDPIFLALGSPAAEQIAQQKLSDILSNPQQLNAYSYALDNPITKEDPSGKLSTTALLVGLLTNLSGLLTQLSLNLGGSFVAGHSGIPGVTSQALPVASSLVNRSLTLNPSVLTVTSQNQGQYGNVVNEIEQSSAFQSQVATEIKNAKKGEINAPPGGANSFAFPVGSSPGEEDLHLAFDKVALGLQGSESSNGTWNLNVTVQDTFQFYPESFAGKADTALNTYGAIEQNEGIISPYQINVNFDYAYHQ